MHFLRVRGSPREFAGVRGSPRLENPSFSFGNPCILATHTEAHSKCIFYASAGVRGSSRESAGVRGSKILHSHQPSGLGWFSQPVFFQPFCFQPPLGRGLPLPLPPPRGPGPEGAGGVGASCCDFLPILVAFFFPTLFQCIFLSILERFVLPTWAPNPPKSKENRCQDAFPS